MLQLKVVPQEPLPLQLRLAREQVARNMGRSLAPTRDLPQQALPYQLYSVPTIDQTWSLYGGRTGTIQSWSAAS